MSTTLVGRRPERDLLARTLRAAADGRGAAVLVSGEAGIGKTALAEHVAELARRQGFTVLAGQADPLRVRYAPIVAALRPQLTGSLLAGLDDLGRLVPHPALRPSPAGAGSAADRARMFDAASRLVGRLADRAPALLLLEDLHHADADTLDLLRHLVATEPRLLLLGTYRTAPPGSALRRFAGRTRHHHLPLGPLDDAEVAELAGGFRPGLVARSGGNPLFVTALAHPDGPARRVARDVVLDRLRAVRPAERRALELAAAEAVLSDSPPLEAEITYAELTGSERAARHAAVARELELTAPDDVVALAPHYLRGGDHLPPLRVLNVLSAAARQVPPADATTYLHAAVGVARAHAPHRVTDLLDELGLAHQHAGRLDEAAAGWSEALTRAERAGDGGQRARLRSRVALLAAERGDYSPDSHAEVSVEDVVRAGDFAALLRWVLSVRHRDVGHIRQLCAHLAALSGRDPSPSARSLDALSHGYLALLDGDLGTALDRLTTAHAAAEQCVDTAPELGYAALRLLAGARVLAGDIAGAMRCVEHPPSLLGLPAARLSVGFARVMVLYFAGAPADAQADLQQLIADARQQGLRRLLPRLLAFHAFLLAELGRHPEAIRELTAAKSTLDTSEYGLADLLFIAEATIDPAGVVVPDEPPSFADPMVDCVRLLVAGRAAAATGDVSAARRVAEVLRAASGMSPLLAALADQQEGVIAAMTARPADRLAAGARRLTSRQAEIVALVNAGLSNAEIARRLKVSRRTVETHLRNSYRRLGIGTRTGLAVWATR